MDECEGQGDQRGETDEIKKELKIKKENWLTYLRNKAQQSYEEYKAQRTKVNN